MTYEIDRDAHLVRITGSGVLTDEEMLDCVSALRADPRLEPDMHSLSDMRDIEVGFTPAGVEKMVRIMRTTAARRSPSCAAIVVGKDVAYGMARMFEIESEIEEVNPEFRIFRDMESATDWLDIEE